MKTTDAKEKKQLKQLSDEELEKVTGGSWTGFGPEECKDREYACSHQKLCKITCPHMS